MLKNSRGNVLRVVGTLLPFAMLAGTSFAEGPTISGYVESNYVYDLASPSNGATTLRIYDNKDKDINSNAHLAVTGALGENAGYVVEVDAGSDVPVTSFPATDDFDIQEAYLTYTSACKLGVKVGKFATYEGIEVIEGPANPTISRGYLYGWAEPFTHTGGVLTLALGKLDFAAGLVNGWDTPNDNNDTKTVVGKVGLNLGDPLLLTLSGYHGPEQAETVDNVATPLVNEKTDTSGLNRDSIDLTGLTKIIPRVDLWFQFNMGQEPQTADTDADGIKDDLGMWSGAGIQPVIHLTEKFSIGGRLEYFDDNGARTGVNELAATNVTITPQWMLTDGVAMRLEYRYDTANKKIWFDDEGKAQDTASTVGVQFWAQF